MQDLNVLYEDNHIIVVIKPRNILTQGDNTGDPNMVDLLKQYLKEKYNKPGNVFVGLVHRLDRPVGGVMVFAKTSKGASRLSDVIRRKQFDKRYLAVVSGRLTEKQGTLEHYIEKDSRKNRVVVKAQPFGNAKDAKLNYEVVSCNEECSLVKVELITGRPHQIRAQFSAIGHPLIGDLKYGGQRSERSNDGSVKLNNVNVHEQITPALWSYYISFKHPVKDEIMEFEQMPVWDEYPWSIFH